MQPAVSLKLTRILPPLQHVYLLHSMWHPLHLPSTNKMRKDQIPLVEIELRRSYRIQTLNKGYRKKPHPKGVGVGPAERIAAPPGGGPPGPPGGGGGKVDRRRRAGPGCDCRQGRRPARKTYGEDETSSRGNVRRPIATILGAGAGFTGRSSEGGQERGEARQGDVAADVEFPYRR